MGENKRRKDRDEQIEELERQHTIKLRLGYQPEAAPPDLANVKSRINNKHTTTNPKRQNAGKKPTKDSPSTHQEYSQHRKKWESEEFWPPTPPMEEPEVQEHHQSPEKDQSPVEHRRRTLIDPDFNAGNSRNGGRSRKVEKEETEFYIRESTSAPLETPLAPVPAAASNHHARPPSVKAFDVFRPPGYQHPVGSGGSGSSRQYLLNGVNEGIKVEADEPLPVTPDRCQQSPTEDEAVKQMWDEAVRDLSKDNKRQQLRQSKRSSGSAEKLEEEENFDMSDVFCLFPCCCCCFCLCRRRPK